MAALLLAITTWVIYQAAPRGGGRQSWTSQTAKPGGEAGFKPEGHGNLPDRPSPPYGFFPPFILRTYLGMDLENLAGKAV
jgi:hypothetical protein